MKCCARPDQAPLSAPAPRAFSTRTERSSPSHARYRQPELTSVLYQLVNRLRRAVSTMEGAQMKRRMFTSKQKYRCFVRSMSKAVADANVPSPLGGRVRKPGRGKSSFLGNNNKQLQSRNHHNGNLPAPPFPLERGVRNTSAMQSASLKRLRERVSPIQLCF